ncbi:MAG TPA: hypothetical protein VMH61_01705 [Candidatus Acidoferrales bacterium]|nr:hypothetical protein [Candidatus Acidoferrales bacterium]
MNGSRTPPRASLATAINRVAIALALLALAGIGAWWWHDRTRVWEPVRWDARRFVCLRAPDSAAAAAWIVAYQPDCPHCRARLADLLRRDPSARAGAALGVLVVDAGVRPELPSGAERLTGGVWWDSLGIWRARWGHRVYGEALSFARDGRLQRTIGPADPPGAPATAASP